MGMNTIPRSVSMRISPGKRPNQLKAQGANCSIAPTTSSAAPAIMIHFAMFSVPVRYSIPSKIINHHELVGTSRLRTAAEPVIHNASHQRPAVKLVEQLPRPVNDQELLFHK
jgi:hypothetical protein